MADFPDNWPAQLNNYPEEKQIFFTEAMMTLDWHKRAADYFLTQVKPDVFIQDLYTPNQMLESRWWMPYLDPASTRYPQAGTAERLKLRDEMREMYKGIDAILGEAIKHSDKNTYIILSSDHGIIPLNKYVLPNNLFASKGLLKFTLKPKTGEPQVDWGATKAIHLQMHGIYLGTAGLAGNWKRGSGPEYETLRGSVIKMLRDLRDGDIAPFKEVLTREDAAVKFHLPPDRIADIVLVMRPGYGLSEDMSTDLKVFRPAVAGGYKQALDATGQVGLRTPFMVMGPGVKKGFRFPEVISNIDQAPTILKLLDMPRPAFMQGKPLNEIFNN
jgi:predicted AlkP superfamily phosphohydrolase/phosphomutase